jgi:hypothetical protein
VNPSHGLSVSAWYGYLRSPEALEPEISLHRLGAAVLATSRHGERSWSTSLVYGANVALGSSRSSNSALFEGSVDLDRMNTVFGRLEYVQKSPADLAVPGASKVLYDVGEVSLGYFRTLRHGAGVVLGVGARGTINLVPPTLRDGYGGWPVGAVVYIALRPRDTQHGHGSGEGR